MDARARGRAWLAAHEEAQRLRIAGDLIEAREELRACSAEACPGLVQRDCVGWLREVEAAMAGPLAADHAAQLIVAPPAAEGEPGALGSSASFTGAWASRRVEGGYEVGLQIPWSFLGGEIPAAGRGVLFNVAVDVVGPAGERYQSFLRYQQADGGTVWCNDTAAPKPATDDRSWCRPELAP